MLKELTAGTSLHSLELSQGGDPLHRCKQKFEDLKNSDFYNRSTEMWIDELGSVSRHRIFTQIAGLLIELELDRKNGAELYEEFKEDFYHSNNDQWLSYTSENSDDAERTDIKLLALGLEYEIDPKSAESEFFSSKSSEIYDAGKARWLASKDPEGAATGHVQLLGCLIELRIDPAEGQKIFKKLQESEYYNEAANKWRNVEYKKAPDAIVFVQLVSILCDIEINPDRAKSNFESLKKAPNYSEAEEFWGEGLGRDKLFALLIEIRLAKKLGSVEFEAELPMVRKF